MNDVLFSSKSDLWETPQDLFDSLNDQYHFTLDACATPENAKCKVYYTEKDDGLKQPWIYTKGAIWCNPPYGRTIGKWVEKAYTTSTYGKTVVMLLPSRTDTIWFHKYILNRAEIIFVRGRLKFGNSKNSAPFPSMIVVFKGNNSRRINK